MLAGSRADAAKRSTLSLFVTRSRTSVDGVERGTSNAICTRLFAKADPNVSSQSIFSACLVKYRQSSFVLRTRAENPFPNWTLSTPETSRCFEKKEAVTLVVLLAHCRETRCASSCNAVSEIHGSDNTPSKTICSFMASMSRLYSGLIMCCVRTQYDQLF